MIRCESRSREIPFGQHGYWLSVISVGPMDPPINAKKNPSSIYGRTAPADYSGENDMDTLFFVVDAKQHVHRAGEVVRLMALVGARSLPIDQRQQPDLVES